MDETDTSTEKQERRFEAEVASDSNSQITSFGEKLIRSLVYEICWSIWFLFVFEIFQPECRCKVMQYYKFVTNQLFSH